MLDVLTGMVVVDTGLTMDGVVAVTGALLPIGTEFGGGRDFCCWRRTLLVVVVAVVGLGVCVVATELVVVVVVAVIEAGTCVVAIGLVVVVVIAVIEAGICVVAIGLVVVVVVVDPTAIGA